MKCTSSIDSLELVELQIWPQQTNHPFLHPLPLPSLPPLAVKNQRTRPLPTLPSKKQPTVPKKQPTVPKKQPTVPKKQPTVPKKQPIIQHVVPASHATHPVGCTTIQ